MTIADVLHVLVDRLPADWDQVKAEMHEAVRGHFAQDKQPTPKPTATEPPAS